jgi:sigma-B regulation protein RsbU (phosphoserine phosphatase)
VLRGIAQSGGDGPPEDRYGIVVALSQLSQTLTEAEADSAFRAAAETAAALLHVSAIVVFARRGDELIVGGGAGLGTNQAVLELAREAAQAALAADAPVFCPGTKQESPLARTLGTARMAAVLCVPMRVGEATVGAIAALSKEPRVFTPQDIELLYVVASHAALAAWHSKTQSITGEAAAENHEDMIRHAERKIRELTMLNQVSEAMSSTLKLDVLLRIALEQSLTVVGADAGSLMLVGEESNRLEIVASQGLDHKLIENTSQQVGESIAGWVAQHGEAVLVTDAHADTRFQMPFFRDNIACAASVPLKARGVVIGVLNVNTRREDKTFDERDIELLTTVANQMAVAIDNARLYDRVNRRTKQLDGLLQISRTITSTLNLDEVLRRLGDEICKLFGLEVCVVLILDEMSGRFRFGYGTGLKTRRKYVYYDLAAPLAGRVKITGRKMILRDINASSNLRSEVSVSEGLKSAVCLPLKNEGRLVGIAAAFSRQEHVFPRSQKDIMRPLGELGGVAIRNARVYRQKYRIAEMLQQRLVQTDIPQLAGLDVGHRLMPAREVGGDYYHFIKSGDSRISVVVADVSGNDVEAAEYTTMGKHVLRTYAREFKSPAEVLTKTNDLICEDTTAEVFISLFYGTVDLAQGELTYANAGCEPPILYNASTRSIQQLTTDGILLGIKRGSKFEERVVKLGRGDILALYTDGLTEASVDGRQLGSRAVMDTVCAHADLHAQGIADKICDVLHEHVHGRVTDDVALVVLKIL